VNTENSEGRMKEEKGSQITETKNREGEQIEARRNEKGKTSSPIGILLNQELHETLGISNSLSPRVGSEGELSSLVSDSSGLELLLVLSDPSDLRVSVDDGRNGVVVDVSVSVLDDLDGGDT